MPQGVELGTAYISILPTTEKLAPAIRAAMGQIESDATSTGNQAGENMADGVGKKMKAAAVGIGLVAGALIGKGLIEAVGQAKIAGKLEASLGLSPKDAKKYGDVAGSLYANAYGESVEQVSGVVESAISNFPELRKQGAKAIEEVSATALDFEGSFGIEAGRVMQVLGVSVKNGLVKNTEEGFDLLYASMQRVPVESRESVTDALEEYAPFFADIGIQGEQAFALLTDAASKSGFGIDKVGDALKEFTIRVGNISDTAAQDAMKGLGLDAEAMTGAIVAGGPEAAGAFDTIVDSLLGIKDPAKQAEAAIALFGTPVEDLGLSDIPAFLDSLDTGAGSLGDFEGAAERAGKALNDNASTNLTAFIRGGKQRLVDFLGKAVVPTITALSRGLAPAFAVVKEAAMGVLEFVKENSEWFIALGAGVAVTVGILAGYAAVTKTLAIVTAAWQKVQLLLNGTLLANPLMLTALAVGALVAAFVLAYRNSDVFRAKVDAAWAAIKTGISAAWAVIKPKLMEFKNYIVNDLMPMVQRLWANYVQPAFAAIGSFIATTWTNVIRPALAALGGFIMGTLVPVVMRIGSIVGSVFGVIGTIIMGTWQRFIYPAFQAISWQLTNVLFPVLMFLWKNVVAPVMGAVGTIIAGAWNNVIRPVFSAFGAIFDDVLIPAFRTGMDVIGGIWDGLKAMAAVPVNFIIDTVYNDGIRKVINLIPGVTDLAEAQTLNFATGGVLPGYTPGRDVHQFYSPTAGGLNLSGGEAIMRPEFTRAIGEGGVAALNRAARTGGRKGVAKTLNDYGINHFATGGVFWPTNFRSLSPNYGGHTGVDINKPGASDYGMPVFATQAGTVRSYDLGNRSYGKYLRVSHGGGLSTIYAHLSEFIKTSGQVMAGQPIGRIGSTGNSTGPHLHFEVRPGGTYASALNYLNGGQSPASFAGASGSGSGTASNWWDVIMDLPGMVKNVWDDISGMADSGWFKMMKDAGFNSVRNAVGWVCCTIR